MSFFPQKDSRTAPKSLSLSVLLLIGSPAYGAFKGFPEAKGTDRDSTLTQILPSYPNTLNPIMVTSVDENEIVTRYTISEPLIVNDPDTGEPVCWLCESYSFETPERKSALFKLRKNVTFHDGKPMTAEDVVFSSHVTLHPKVDNLQSKSMLIDKIEKVEAVDPLTVRITFKSNKFDTIYTLANLSIIPKHLFPKFDEAPEKFAADTTFSRAPIGTGPYRFVKWENGQLIELERNENWWGKNDPAFEGLFNFKTLRFKIITNDQVRIQAFKKGDSDLLELTSFHYDDLKKENLPGITVQEFRGKGPGAYGFLALNSRRDFFSDAKTRQAMALLMDRFSTLKKFARGLRLPTNGPYGPDSPHQCPVSECPVIPFDPAKAKVLLKEAGWADTDKDGCLDRTVDGKKQVLKFSILGPSDEQPRNILSVYVSEMKKAGVCAETKLMDWSASLKLVDDLQFDANYSGWRMEHPVQWRQLYHSTNSKKTGSNYTGLMNPELDALIEQFEMQYDETARQAISKKIHKIIYDSYTWVYHHEGNASFLAHRGLGGVQPADYAVAYTYWPRFYRVKK